MSDIIEHDALSIARDHVTEFSMTVKNTKDFKFCICHHKKVVLILLFREIELGI
jgi:hypothetical protein